ncbi:MAG: ABC transporter substrate-binding protein [Halolamina sp.]
MSQDDTHRVSEERRRLLQGAGMLAAGGLAGLAGCAGGGGGESPTATASAEEMASATETPGQPQQGGDFVYALSDDSQKLDPHYRVTKASSQLLVNVVDPLFRINNELQPVPNIVADYSVSDDNLEYVFTIREGLMFHPPVDRELTAEDVAASLTRIKEDTSAAAHNDLKRAESIEATGDYEVTLTLAEPFAPILTTLARDTTAILPKDYFEEMSSKPVGSGAFVFEEREKGNFAQLSAFDGYWQEDLPYFDTVKSRPISDGSVRLTELDTGNVHVVGSVPSNDAGSVEDNDALSLEPLSGLAIEEFAFNNEVEPFTDKRVRKAISHAVDKEKLVKFALEGYGSTAATTLPPQSAYAIDADPLAQDFETAQSLLDDAGYGDGFETTIKLPSSYPRSVKLGTPVKEWLKQIGIEAELEKVTWDNWISNVFGKGEFEMTTVPFYGAFNPHVALYKIFRTDATFNFFNYSNEEFDALVDEGAKTADTEKRTELYKEAQQIMREDLPIFLPFYRDQLFARRKTVENQLVWGSGSMRFWRNWFEK